MKIFISFCLIIFTLQAQASTNMTQDQARTLLQDTVSKIIRFFREVPELNNDFPEFESSQLVNLLSTLHISIEPLPVLIDSEGINRDCINLNSISGHHITCRLDYINNYKDSGEDLFILTFHELLGLLGVERSSRRANISLRESYHISARIARFVTQIGTHDLVYSDGVRDIECTINIVFHNHLNINRGGYFIYPVVTQLNQELSRKDYSVHAQRADYYLHVNFLKNISPEQKGCPVSLILQGRSGEEFYRAQSTTHSPFRELDCYHQNSAHIVTNIPSCFEIQRR